MKFTSWIFVPVIAVSLLGAACQSAPAKPEPQPHVIVVPGDEMTRTPGMDPAGDSTPSAETQVSTTPPNPAAKLVYNSCNVDGPFIAMTFDDGPAPGQTDRLLDMLKARNIRATFFVLGQNVAASPEIIRRMAADGHEIGNHSWDHKAFTKLGTESVASQINRTNGAIVQAGAPAPKIMRMPYGATNSSLNRRMNEEFGQKVIMWSLDPLDWKYRNSARVTKEILQNVRSGSIVLAHDIHATTINAMPGTLDGLIEKGFQFVTVSELIAMDRPEAAKSGTKTP